MKFYTHLFIVLFISLSSCSFLDNDYIDEINAERLSKDSTFLIEKESPLSPEQIAKFTSLNYFPVNESYVVEARIETFDDDQIIQLKTSTDRLPDYKVYAYVYFEIENETHRLTAYQSIKLQQDSVYKNYLFLPFTDNNSTITTYGGGRYIDFQIPKGDTFTLDFNKAYNPYCAYNHKWSCVIPPRENAMTIAINAGEKTYSDEH